MQKIIELSYQLLEEENSGKPFHDIGVASLRFAKEYPVLFRDFVINQNNYTQNYNQDMGQGLIEQMKGDGELMTIFLKMQIFTTGLSIMVANGMLPEEFNEEKVVKLLGSTATDVITSAYLQKKET